MAKKSKKNIPCTFGPVSFRKRVAAIGLRFTEDDMPVEEARDLLKNAQVEVAMRVDKSAGNDVDGQERFVATDLLFEGVGEIHSVSMGDGISCSVCFPINDTDKMSLLEMRCAEGKIDMKRTGDAEVKKPGRPRKDDDDDEDGDDDADGQQRITVGK